MYNNQYLSSETPSSDTFTGEGETCNVSNFERAISVAVGAFLIYRAIKKIGRKPLRSISRIAAGGALVYRGVSGYCPVYDQISVDGTKSEAINIRTTFTVNKPKQEVYNFWRKLENLPLFMKHISKVTETDNRRSHWEARIPEGNPIAIKWDAEIVKDEEGSLLSWQSLPGSTIENAGKIEFRDALGHMGTELRVMITYRPPAGNVGAGIAKLLNPVFEKIVREDVNNFKSFVDAGSMTSLEKSHSKI